MLYTNKGPVDCSSDFGLSNVKGKSAIVTGGASGIGKGYVDALAKAGAFVTIGDINEDDGQRVVSSYEGNVQFCKCDVRNWDDQLAMFKAATSNSPSKCVDIVVANAGIAGEDPLFQLDDPKNEPKKPEMKILDVNLYGVMYTTKLALHYFQISPLDRDRDRCLVVQSSIAGYVDLVGAPQYQVSKFGGRGLMVCLRNSAAGLPGVRVNSINPWFVQTPIMNDALVKFLNSKGVEWATVEDCARALLQIAADKSINGRALGIVPRSVDKNGYLDIDRDDYSSGNLLKNFADQILRISGSIPLEQADLLKKVVDAIKDLVQDCNFDCNDSGIALQAMDNSHVALVAMMLKSESFSPFRCDRNIALGINLTSLTKVLRAAQSSDILTLKAEDAPDVVELQFESANADRISEYAIKLMDIDQDHLGIPETEYSATITMPSAEFQRICRDLMAISESVAIECTKEGVKFSAAGDIGSGSVSLRSHTDVENPKENVEIDLSEPVALTFSLKYLVNFCKATGLSTSVKLCLSSEVPLLVEYALSNNSYLRFYLAPKIGDEE